MSTSALFFEHNLWANRTLLEACRDVTEENFAYNLEGTYGPTGQTLVHMLSGEQSYLARLSGERKSSPLKSSDPWPGIDALLEHARWSGERLIDLARVTPINARFTSEYDDENWGTQSWVVLVQAINHSTEHRAHAMSALTAQGVALPEIDGWTWGEASGRTIAR